jgi:hypothetical protein
MAQPPELTILDWIIEISRDPGLYERFRTEPDDLIRESRLDDKQKRVLLSHDSSRIRNLIEYELNLDPEVSFMHIPVPPMHWVPEPPSQS